MKTKRRFHFRGKKILSLTLVVVLLLGTIVISGKESRAASGDCDFTFHMGYKDGDDNLWAVFNSAQTLGVAHRPDVIHIDGERIPIEANQFGLVDSNCYFLDYPGVGVRLLVNENLFTEYGKSDVDVHTFTIPAGAKIICEGDLTYFDVKEDISFTYTGGELAKVEGGSGENDSTEADFSFKMGYDDAEEHLWAVFYSEKTLGNAHRPDVIYIDGERLPLEANQFGLVDAECYFLDYEPGNAVRMLLNEKLFEEYGKSDVEAHTFTIPAGAKIINESNLNYFTVTEDISFIYMAGKLGVVEDDSDTDNIPKTDFTWLSGFMNNDLGFVVLNSTMTLGGPHRPNAIYVDGEKIPVPSSAIGITDVTLYFLDRLPGEQVQLIVHPEIFENYGKADVEIHTLTIKAGTTIYGEQGNSSYVMAEDLTFAYYNDDIQMGAVKKVTLNGSKLKHSSMDVLTVGCNTPKVMLGGVFRALESDGFTYNGEEITDEFRTHTGENRIFWDPVSEMFGIGMGEIGTAGEPLPPASAHDAIVMKGIWAALGTHGSTLYDFGDEGITFIFNAVTGKWAVKSATVKETHTYKKKVCTVCGVNKDGTGGVTPGTSKPGKDSFKYSAGWIRPEDGAFMISLTSKVEFGIAHRPEVIYFDDQRIVWNTSAAGYADVYFLDRIPGQEVLFFMAESAFEYYAKDDAEEHTVKIPAGTKLISEKDATKYYTTKEDIVFAVSKGSDGEWVIGMVLDGETSTLRIKDMIGTIASGSGDTGVASGTASPQTGDTNDTTLWLVLMLVAVVSGAVCYKRRKSKIVTKGTVL